MVVVVGNLEKVRGKSVEESWRAWIVLVVCLDDGMSRAMAARMSYGDG